MSRNLTPFYMGGSLDEPDMPSSTSQSAGSRNNWSSVDESGTSDRFGVDRQGHRDAPAPSVLVSAKTAVRATPDTAADTVPTSSSTRGHRRTCGAVCCRSSRLGSRNGHAELTLPLDLDPVRCRHHQLGRPLSGTGPVREVLNGLTPSSSLPGNWNTVTLVGDDTDELSSSMNPRSARRRQYSGRKVWTASDNGAVTAGRWNARGGSSPKATSSWFCSG